MKMKVEKYCVALIDDYMNNYLYALSNVHI